MKTTRTGFYLFIVTLFTCLLAACFWCFETFGQVGGFPPFPRLTAEQALQNGYTLVDNADSLIVNAAEDNAKIYIGKSFTLNDRVTVSGRNVLIESDRRCVVTCKKFFSTFRVFESFLVTGKNVTMKGLILRGDGVSAYTLDSMWFQTGIRCYADSFNLIDCEVSYFGWANMYFHLYAGARVEGCYFSNSHGLGYSYGLWFEGKTGMRATVKKCWFGENRESVDAGGQLNTYTLDSCVFEQGVDTHNNSSHLAAIGIGVTNSNFIGPAYLGYIYPSTDTGWVRFVGNYFERAEPAIYVDTVDNLINPLASITISDNHYNGEGMNRPPPPVLSIDSIYTGRVKFSYKSSEKYFEVDYGNGFERFFTSAVKHDKSFIPGAYMLGVRAISKTAPSKWVYKTLIVPGDGVSFAVKTTNRFTPGRGFAKVELFVNDTVRWSRDAADIYEWRHYYVPMKLSGQVKIAIRMTCTKEMRRDLTLWIDDFDVNGKVLNPFFSDTLKLYQSPVSLWRYRAVGFSPGCTVDPKEHCSGNRALEFEWRYDEKVLKKPIPVGALVELYQTVKL